MFERLRAALVPARALADAGAAFVVAPLPASDGTIVRRVGDQLALSLYRYVDGRTERGEYQSAADRLAVLEMLVVVHASPDPVTRSARVDDFELANRDELVHALADLAGRWSGGPYSERRGRCWPATRRESNASLSPTTGSPNWRGSGPSAWC